MNVGKEVVNTVVDEVEDFVSDAKGYIVDKYEEAKDTYEKGKNVVKNVLNVDHVVAKASATALVNHYKDKASYDVQKIKGQVGKRVNSLKNIGTVKTKNTTDTPDSITYTKVSHVNAFIFGADPTGLTRGTYNFLAPLIDKPKVTDRDIEINLKNDSEFAGNYHAGEGLSAVLALSSSGRGMSGTQPELVTPDGTVVSSTALKGVNPYFSSREGGDSNKGADNVVNLIEII